MSTSQTEPKAVATTQAAPPRKSGLAKKVFLALGAILAALAVVIALQSEDFRVARSATMNVPPEAVFAQINDLHRWNDWSPWAKLDPNAKNTFEGASEGTGSIFRWSGDSNVGEGSMTIVESRPNDLIRIKLEFIRPFAGTNEVEFTFKPVGEQTKVTWNMSGKKNFMAKAMGLVMDCEEMCGGFFDQGLASIKSIVETKPNP